MPGSPDVEATNRIISSCDFTISSSLHGLIMADSYSIPGVKTNLNGKIIGGSHKFIGYDWSTGRFIKEIEPNNDLKKYEYLASYASREKLQRRLNDCITALKSLNL